MTTSATLPAAVPVDPELRRRTLMKFKIRRWVGEPYVGKRMKLRHLGRVLRSLPIAANPKVLEVGSGDGVFTHYLAMKLRGSDVEGVELDGAEAAVTEAWARAANVHNLRFSQGNALELDLAGKYDLVACLDVLEHIPDDRGAVAAMYAALRPGGALVVHTPSRFYQRLDGSLHTVPDNEAYKINPGHVRNGYTPDEMRALMASAGPGEVRVLPRHGRLTDLAHSVYRKLENPAPLRLLTLPIVDTLWWLDTLFPGTHGNTVFGVIIKPH